MKREEQIRQAAVTYIGHLQDLGEDITITNERNAFIEGAKWADNNPKEINGKELLYVAQKTTERVKKEFINKACDWLEDNIDKYSCDYNVAVNSLIASFRKAMEE